MIRRPPRSTRTDTLFPYTTRFRSALRGREGNMINGFDFVDTTDTAKPDATPPEGAMHTDLERPRKGRVGAQFWSVYVPSTPDEAPAVQQKIVPIDVMKRPVAPSTADLKLPSSAEERRGGTEGVSRGRF